MTWISVGRLEDIPVRGARVVETPRGPVAVFRTVGDKVFAIDDRCPHRGGPLSQGIVHGERVTCPLHGWKISLAEGEAVAPDEGCTARHPARVVDGRVEVSLAAELPRSA
ncbi:MAG: nitrite reductase small subunit NirD [Myxococcota bacterium]